MSWLISLLTKKTNNNSSESQSSDDIQRKIWSELDAIGNDLRSERFARCEQRAMGVIEKRDQVAEPRYIDFALSCLEHAWLRQEKFQEAISYFSKYVVQYPFEAGGFRGRAAVHWYTDELDQSNSDYSKALQLDPSDATALMEYGQVLAEKGEHAEAVRHLDRALELAAQFPRGDLIQFQAFARNGKGVALAGLGQIEGAFTEFEASISGCPENAWAYFNRAGLYLGLGEKEKAVRDYRNALQKRNPPLPPIKRIRAERQLKALG